MAKNIKLIQQHQVSLNWKHVPLHYTVCRTIYIQQSLSAHIQTSCPVTVCINQINTVLQSLPYWGKKQNFVHVGQF